MKSAKNHTIKELLEREIMLYQYVRYACAVICWIFTACLIVAFWTSEIDDGLIILSLAITSIIGIGCLAATAKRYSLIREQKSGNTE